MLGREKIYQDELEAMEVDPQRVGSECGIEPSEHEAQVDWLFEVCATSLFLFSTQPADPG